jgi:hypothetical protein
MRITVFALATAALVFAAGLPVMGANEEQARLAVRRFKDIYLQCLSNEAIKVLPQNMSGSDFEIYIKGRCLDEANQFRITMADYLDIKYPDSAAATHINSADRAISEAIENIAKFYAGFKTKGGTRSELQNGMEQWSSGRLTENT